MHGGLSINGINVLTDDIINDERYPRGVFSSYYFSHNPYVYGVTVKVHIIVYTHINIYICVLYVHLRINHTLLNVDDSNPRQVVRAQRLRLGTPVQTETRCRMSSDRGNGK